MKLLTIAISTAALAAAISSASAQTTQPMAPPPPAVTGTVTTPTLPANPNAAVQAPGPVGGAPNVTNPSATPSGQNPAVDQGTQQRGGGR